MVNWLDISLSLRPGMPTWPGDPPFSLRKTLAIARGDECNLSQIEMGTHTGTHVDAPSHYVDSGATLGEMPVEAMIGLARVVPIEDPESVQPSELSKWQIGAGERILLKTRNSERRWTESPWQEDAVFIAPSAASYLVERRILSVGIDSLSVGGPGTGAKTHRLLLSAGIWIMEGLDLSRVDPGTYELMCLPLRIEGSDGAPARVMLRKPTV